MAKTKAGKSKKSNYQIFQEQQKEKERLNNYIRWQMMHDFLCEVRRICKLPIIERENPYKVRH